MPELPRTFEDSLGQMATAISAAILRGKLRGQVEFRTPGLNLLLALPPLVSSLVPPVLVLFPDAGAAALALKQLGAIPDATFSGVGQARAEGFNSFILINISAVEIQRVEQLASQVTDCPFVLVNPQLSAGVVGIGLAGRQLRTRFLSTFETLYHLEPLDDNGALRRAYPSNWEIWQEREGIYQLVTERGQRPTPEELNNSLTQKKPGFMAEAGKFWRALGR